MTKKKSVKEVVEQNDNNLLTNNELNNEEFEVVAVEDTPTVAEVSIEYEADPENPNTEKSLMSAKIEIKPKDSKIAILETFASIMKIHGRHGLVSAEIGEQIWNLWRAYTNRTDKWRRCSSCLIPKAQKLIKECQRFNIPIR